MSEIQVNKDSLKTPIFTVSKLGYENWLFYAETTYTSAQNHSVHFPYRPCPLNSFLISLLKNF